MQNSTHCTLENKLNAKNMQKKGCTEQTWLKAPSHTKLPPAEIEEPNAPMESICIDFAMIDSDRFGVMVDRFSNWPTIWSCKGTSLCHWLRKHIENFGAPKIISTDRGKEFESRELKKMLETYNIYH